VVSKNKYYEYKLQGLCVKCGKARGTSPSEVRCSECHSKYIEAKKEKKEERLEEALCIQCGKEPLVGHSKYCAGCREKNADYKKNATAKPISVYKENNEHCRLCNGPIDTLGIVCQKCLEQVQFTKMDAVIRYGSQCNKCFEDDPEKLVFASIDISVPMKHTGPDLYKFVCFSTSAPKDYMLVCNKCYWKANYDYIQNLRNLLLNKTEENDDFIDGIVGSSEEIIEEDGEEDDELD
jgi:hypothetical protein